MSTERRIESVPPHHPLPWHLLLMADPSRTAIADARTKGIREIHVATGNSSLEALALYQKTGFRLARIEPDYFPAHYPEPIYEHGIWCRDRVWLIYRFDPD